MKGPGKHFQGVSRLVNSEPRPGAERFDANETEGGAGALWRELGLGEPDFLDPSLAPDVDQALLRRLIRQELPENVARAVYRLIYSFSSWHEAHGRILLDELKKTDPQS